MKKLTSNWGLKLASLIFAIIVWFLVTNINDPVTSVRYTNIPVTLKNTNLITDQGQVYTILDGSDTISSVTIYAPRSIIDAISQNNVVATADVQNLSALNTLSIDVTTNKYSDRIESIVTSSDVVRLSVERKASKTLALTATTSGTLSDGYIIGDVTTEQNMIRINGPESVVSQVASASVDVDVTGFVSNIGTDADIVLYDADGEVVDSSLVTMNIKSVRVNVTIYGTKYVPLEYVISGEPASGYMLTGQIESNPSEVLIAGRSSVLNSTNAITIDDPGLDVSGLTGNLTYTVDVTDYLPSGVMLGDKDFNGTAAVTVHIGSLAEETFDIDIGNVTIDEQVEGFDIAVDNSEYSTVSLTLQGLASTLMGLDSGDIKGTVGLSDILSDNNLEEIQEGTYSAEVNWNLPDGVKVKTDTSVYVKVQKKN